MLTNLSDVKGLGRMMCGGERIRSLDHMSSHTLADVMSTSLVVNSDTQNNDRR